ncbi:MAG: ATP-binding cassette domain-containing protein [Albidovulum sp.]|nr:ATP-binding cassette domain-containing protein [Albidovulum sp.]
MPLAKNLEIDIRIEFSGFALRVEQTKAIDGALGLFGPSGAGKSTLLRIISGVETSAAGRLAFDGEVWQDSGRREFVKPYRRAVGCVFQNPQLFSHLSVSGNLKYGYRRRRGRRGLAFAEVLHALDLAPLLNRTVDALSGGEMQRVAIGRALLLAPRLLLLDEPLAALDDTRKSEIMPYLERVLAEFGIPAIYVSHSPDEVARLCDDAWILEGGSVTGRGIEKLPAGKVRNIELRATAVGMGGANRLICKIGDDEVVAEASGNFEREAPVKLTIPENCVVFAFDKCPSLLKAGAIGGWVSDVGRGAGCKFIGIELETAGGRIGFSVPSDYAAGMDLSKGQRAYAIFLDSPSATGA